MSLKRIKRYVVYATVSILVGKFINYLMYDFDWSILLDFLV